MYVCLCRGVTDGHIREAISEGCCSYRDVRQATGVAGQCGKCACEAKNVVRKELAKLGTLAQQSQLQSLAYSAA